MNNIVFMHVFNCTTNLLHVSPYFLLFHWLSGQPLVQVIPRTGLQQKIYGFCISCETEKIDDVWMVHVTLDLALSDQLGEGLLVQVALFYGLKAVQGISEQVLDQVNFAVAALIDELQDLEYLLFVVDGQDFQLVLFALRFGQLGKALLWLLILCAIFPLQNTLNLLGETSTIIFLFHLFYFLLSKNSVLFKPQTFLHILLLDPCYFAFIGLFIINKIALFFSYKRGQCASCKILREKER